MGKQLIIVESPAKVKTIKKFLGPQYMVQASVGHVRDLPSSSLGVDEANDFAPHYEVIDNKKNVVSELRAAASKADTVYLAPDPDREGEAIAWHVAELIRDKAKDIKRIQFNEITAKAVKEALAHPRELNGHLFDAQQARRVLDRLVGYKISPLLWKSIKRGISAGRVQSVALRLIVEREEAREVFKPEEYWLFKVLLAADVPPPFKAELAKVGGKKAVVSNAAQAKDIEDAMAGKPFVVESVEEKERERAPQPPFITSTLQQAANQRLSYTAKRTMNIAQRLYEGVELGDRGLTALITYMRTDSTRIADEARDAAKAFIEGNFGKEYLPKRARVYKAKGGAQDAHEAIRPVDVTITPDEVKTHLPPEQYNLYRLIWSRFVASQMAGARFHDTTVSIACAHTQWKAKGERLLFPGFLAAMPRGKDEADAELPPLTAGQTLTLEKLDKEQKFTQPPARFSEASLVRELEELGIGRPSTYAAIISTLQDREYVSLKERHFVPTDLGRVVCTQLVEHFGKLMDVGFTAQMEENLDKVAEGQEQWVELLRRFSEDFNPTLAAASKNMKSLKGGMPANLPCPECGKDLLIKFGKAGAFLACSGYPECRYTSNFERTEDGTVEAVAQEKPQYEKVGDCPQCGKDLVIKKSRTGSSFIACTGYPDCRYAAPLSTGVPCPRCGKGSLVEKSTKRGKIFYSCDQYPQCDFALWDKPVPGPCPRCNSPYLIEKKSRDGAKVICPVKGCGYVKEDGDG
ncbi:MAG TPA: type I DNA topoisomerase [Desulfovibrio sp.]|uniref:type I DNA topoisomerase n=1 Tax=Desulfovibrio sp. TaxID=885 RepID=UPI002D331B93|nr:type I DNA topoisomerase [Desulfovibrio sp.]HZF61441.1 type I DNA topoisomerase [Desulfovibrio sp.]